VVGEAKSGQKIFTVYARCTWQPFFVVLNARIERILEKFVKYALRRLEWDGSRCALINLDAA
jgi:hypothetical protein